MLTKILIDTTRNQWIEMEYDDFIKTVVEPLNMMGHDARQIVINKLSFPQLKC